MVGAVDETDIGKGFVYYNGTYPIKRSSIAVTPLEAIGSQGQNNKWYDWDIMGALFSYYRKLSDARVVMAPIVSKRSKFNPQYHVIKSGENTYDIRVLAPIKVNRKTVPLIEVWEDYEPSEEHVQLTVISVQPNYLDNYLINLKRTWVRGMEIQKELGYIVDYGVWTSESANSPNVWLTITYENMAAMQPNKERYDAVNAEFEKRFGDDDEELDVISKGYEEIRSMVDSQIINRVKFNM